MIRLNLLPWRETAKEKRRKAFNVTMVISIVTGIVFSYGVISYYNLVLSNHLDRNAQVKKEIVIVDAKISEIKILSEKKASIIDRMDVIRTLQDSRPDVVQIFNVIANEVPEGVYLESVQRENTIMTIKGVAESNARISVFMRNLDAVTGFSESKLSIVEQIDSEEVASDTIRRFIVTVEGRTGLHKKEVADE